MCPGREASLLSVLVYPCLFICLRLQAKESSGYSSSSSHLTTLSPPPILRFLGSHQTYTDFAFHALRFRNSLDIVREGGRKEGERERI